MCNAPRGDSARYLSTFEGAASFVAWLRASWPAWKVAIPAPAGGQWVIRVRSWLTLDDRTRRTYWPVGRPSVADG